MLRSHVNIARIVKRGRFDSELSQYELSKKLGYKNGQFISNVERGLCAIPEHKIYELANVLNVPSEHVVVAMVNDYENTLRKRIKIEAENFGRTSFYDLKKNKTGEQNENLH